MLAITTGHAPVVVKPVLIHHTTGCRRGVHARTKDAWAVTCPRCRRNAYVRRFWRNLRRTVRSVSRG